MQEEKQEQVKRDHKAETLKKKTDITPLINQNIIIEVIHLKKNDKWQNNITNRNNRFFKNSLRRNKEVLNKHNSIPKTQHPLLSNWPVKQEKAPIKLHDKAQHLDYATGQAGKPTGSVHVWTYCSSEHGSKNVISGHLEGRHGLVDVLVQAVILHSVAGTQTVLPATALSQEEDLKSRKKMKQIAARSQINLIDVQMLIK